MEWYEFEGQPDNQEMWDRVERLGLKKDDGSLDIERLDALGSVPQFELEAH